MHMADVTKNFWGGHAIVGAHLPIAAGMALGDHYRKDNAVTVCMFGDGATNIGYFHEAVNLAKVWNLPVLWVCENNQYGMGTAVERASAVSEIRQKAEGYEISSARIDGMDIMEVRRGAQEAFDFIRSGKGPFFLEILTYRFVGHSMGDPERYRKSEEVKKWQDYDPIGIYRKYLIGQAIASEVELDKRDEDVLVEVAEAVAFAESSPEPDLQELFNDIYAEEI